ncbi:MAG TPA: Crp/Fnr family transcriptional regulator [Sneathiellales bacterium]|jgi:CRP-like cAMP-binding protein|nr:Crp/Fnr family transcriptional regulator [Sneathiellales bacterium]
MEQYKSGDRLVEAGTEFLSQDRQADSIYTVLSGWAIRYQWLSDGSRQILDFALPGSILGFEPEAMDLNRHSAEALTKLRLCILPRSKLIQLLAEFPEMGIKLASIGRSEQITLAQHLSNVGRRRARARITNLMMELLVRTRATSSNVIGDTIPFPLSQEVIGDALGLTSVHVNRMMRELREDGIAVVRSGKLTILDEERLMEEAELDHRHLATPMEVN